MEPFDKKKAKQNLIEEMNKPAPTFEDIKQGTLNKADEVKRAVLKRLGQQEPGHQAIPRTAEEDVALKLKGQRAMDSVKQNEANNVINRLQQDISDLESMAQFGDHDAQKQIDMKKEVLRRYLMNNQ